MPSRPSTRPEPLPEKIAALLQEARWLLLGVVACYVALVLFGYHRDDPGWSHALLMERVHNPGGRLGAWVADLMFSLFGLSAWWWVAFIGFSLLLAFRRQQLEQRVDQRSLLVSLLGFVMVLVSSAGLEAMRFHTMQTPLPLAPGGILGMELGSNTYQYLGFTGGTLLLLAGMAGGMSLFFGMSWVQLAEDTGAALEKLWDLISRKTAPTAESPAPAKPDTKPAAAEAELRTPAPGPLREEERLEPVLGEDPAPARRSRREPRLQEAAPLAEAPAPSTPAPVMADALPAQPVVPAADAHEPASFDAPIPAPSLVPENGPAHMPKNAPEKPALLNTEPMIEVPPPTQPDPFPRLIPTEAAAPAAGAAVAATQTASLLRPPAPTAPSPAPAPAPEPEPLPDMLATRPPEPKPAEPVAKPQPAPLEISFLTQAQPAEHVTPTPRHEPAAPAPEPLAAAKPLPWEVSELEGEGDDIAFDASPTPKPAPAREPIVLPPWEPSAHPEVRPAVVQEADVTWGGPAMVGAEDAGPHDNVAPALMEVEDFVQARQANKTPIFGDGPLDPIPPLELLDPAPHDVLPPSTELLESISRLIERKLGDFGVRVKVLAAYPGPVITRFEIEPAVGVKGSQVMNLVKDLARALSVVSIRVVETVPGKTCMALELPNVKRQTVRLSEILGAPVYQDMLSPLTVALGKDISGEPIVADVARTPHLLVAGTTGSGKSVGINAMILSLLYKSQPEDVRLILVDPKMLELSIYEGIPHLLAPVVTDMKHASNALNWCVGEMEKRYKLMSALGVRNLAGYNKAIQEAVDAGTPLRNPFSITPEAPEPLDKLPYIVVIIDELADLMMVVGKKIEELIARLAQKARAAGIHLILATQRPSVDVITGLIKANIPTRIAFQVSSKIDSRTILDQMGAETLLGMGDMLFLAPGTGLPVRVHGAFVADHEVHKVVEYLKATGSPDYVDGILTPPEEEGGDLGAEGGEAEEADPLYDQAVEVVLKTRRPSISLVQRHLRIGYNRAARLIEQMERSGLISPMGSNGNREVVVPPREGE